MDTKPTLPFGPPALPSSRAGRRIWARDVLRWLLDEFVYGDPDLREPAVRAMLYNALSAFADPWTGLTQLLGPVNVDLAEVRRLIRTALDSVIRDGKDGTLRLGWHRIGAWIVPAASAGPGVVAAQLRISLNLGDAIVLAIAQILGHVPQSLIRPCVAPGCARIYVGSKNQKFCTHHQAEQARLRQRAAERAFRRRQKKPRNPR